MTTSYRDIPHLQADADDAALHLEHMRIRRNVAAAACRGAEMDAAETAATLVMALREDTMDLLAHGAVESARAVAAKANALLFPLTRTKDTP